MILLPPAPTRLALPEFSVTRLDTIHHADCFVLMDWLINAGIQVDAIITDMPYGQTACAWDTRVDLPAWWARIKRILKPCGIFLTTASEPFASLLRVSNLDWYKYDWVWDKVAKANILNAKNTPLKQHEIICVFSSGIVAHNGQTDRMIYYPQDVKKGIRISKQDKHRLGASWSNRPSHPPIYIYDGSNYPSSIIRFSNADHINSLHPTQKPVALYEYLIRTYTRPGDLILDPFCGSGTTGLAALKTGRHYILGDNQREYVEMARRRIQNADPFQPSALAEGITQLSLFGT